MKKSVKAQILAAAASLALLTGCSSNTASVDKTEEPVTIEETNNEEVDTITKTYEAFTHIVEYVYMSNESPKTNNGEYVNIPIEIPEGYELFSWDKEIIQDMSVYSVNVFLFINTERVEAVGTFDKKANMYLFNEPGTVIKDQSLTLN